MRVLLVHNRYQQRGGEDAVVASENSLLLKHGIESRLLEADNDQIAGAREKLKAAISVFYSTQSVTRIKAAIAEFRPDIVHVHNWFPTLSPAIFGVCNEKSVPVVHTLHNYRLLCARASFYRDGHTCEDCLGKTLRIPGIVHGCYRGSRVGSAAATAAVVAHWRAGTWTHAVDRYIALSEFARSKLIQGGLPAAKIAVKSNTLDCDPGARAGDGGYFAFVGRLTDEKGIPTLLECWRLGKNLPHLRIVGSGPLEDEVRRASTELSNVEWLGERSADEVMELIGNATALVCPSHWYEGMPRVVIEAMAVGTPVIASRLGTYIEMIEHGSTGMLFEAARPEELLKCVQEFVPRYSKAMRARTRNAFDLRYSPEVNFQKLIEIYEEAWRVRCGSERPLLSPLQAA